MMMMMMKATTATTADASADTDVGADVIKKEKDEEENEKEKEEMCALKMCGKRLDVEHRATVRVRWAGAALVPAATAVVAWDAAGAAVLHRECWDVATAALPRAASGERAALIGGPRLRLRVGSAERRALAAADSTAEHFDARVVVRDKARAAAALVAHAHRCVVFTGAGVSTAAGIRDFRGPDGRWTRALQEQQQEQEKQDEEEDQEGRRACKRRCVAAAAGGGTRPVSVREMNRGTAGLLGGTRRGDGVACAVPTVAHRVVTDLVAQGRVALVVTQNVDGLHQAAGVPRDQVVELHGNAFTEFCPVCAPPSLFPSLASPLDDDTCNATTEMWCEIREEIRCQP